MKTYNSHNPYAQDESCDRVEPDCETDGGVVANNIARLRRLMGSISDARGKSGRAADRLFGEAGENKRSDEPRLSGELGELDGVIDNLFAEVDDLHAQIDRLTSL